MGDTANDLQAQGDAAFKRGQWRAALQAYGGVVAAVPGTLRARFRIADALLNSGRRDLAVEVYKAIASSSLEGGMPLFGLVASKMVLLLEPGYEDALAGAAALYAKDSPRLDRERSHGAPAQRRNVQPAE